MLQATEIPRPQAPGLEKREEDFATLLERDLNKELLRFTTAGSVDDGKSTLIGRLLHDSKAVYEDQLAAVKKSRVNRSGKAIDFSLLTDGLRAEREQGITIDVAYRYFSTPKRKFIIADTPGHEQYTRNMATGASTADLAVILVDATKGLLPQTRRHTYIAALLGIPNLVAAINKMDLVDYQEDVFLAVQREFAELAHSLGITFVRSIPISALEGDNVVERSGNMAWYAGETLMGHLENVEIRPAQPSEELRFPIQSVIRPDASFRGFAGRVASGVVRPGDAVVALPSLLRTRVQAIVSYDGEVDGALPAQSVVLKLEDEIDLSRGDMLVSPQRLPFVSTRFAAMVVWMHGQPLELNRPYLLKHTGRQIKAKATRIRFRVNINDFTEHSADRLAMNEIGYVEFEASGSLFFDAYAQNRITGSFIVIDPLSNATLGAGMIREKLATEQSRSPLQSFEGVGLQGRVTANERNRRHGHLPGVVVVNERALAEQLERSLFEQGFEVVVVRQEDTPAAALRVLLEVLWSAGILVVYEAERVSTAALSVVRSVAGGAFLDEASSTADWKSIADKVRIFAEALRWKGETPDEGAQN